MSNEREPRPNEPRSLYENQYGEFEITPGALLADNHSPQAQSRRNELLEFKAANNIYIVLRCSDARYLLSYKGILVAPAIGAAGPIDKYVKAFNQPYVKGIIALPHHPCGGGGLKQQHETHGVPENPNDIDEYVRDHIDHPDSYVQARLVARKISRFTDKPVLAAVHYQKDGRINPTAVYRESKISQDISVFQPFFKTQEEYVEPIRSRFQNLSEMQQEQRPRIGVISSNMNALEVSYPDLTDIPGIAFRIRIPRPWQENGIHVDFEDARIIMRQLHYPVAHFPSMQRNLIETESMDHSLILAMRLTGRPWMRKWIAAEGNELYIAKTDNGRLLDIDILPKAA